MPASESVLKVSYPNEVTSNLEWYKLAQKATDILQKEILKGGGIAPVVLADWSIDKTDQLGNATFMLRLSDVPNDPKAAVAKLSEELIRTDGRLFNVLSRLWGDFLRYRSRRQANDINLYVSGSIQGSERGQ
jgi:hypothetical protein